MTMTMARRANRLRLMLGICLFATPKVVGRSVVRGTVSNRERFVVRLLGARQIVQALISLFRPSGMTLLAGALTDLLHGVSMAFLAALSHRWRKAASIDLGIAAALALANLLGVARGDGLPVRRFGAYPANGSRPPVDL